MDVIGGWLRVGAIQGASGDPLSRPEAGRMRGALLPAAGGSTRKVQRLHINSRCLLSLTWILAVVPKIIYNVHCLILICFLCTSSLRQMLG